jgi:predicted metal-dependent HD superfamily phosphohydrolase
MPINEQMKDFVVNLLNEKLSDMYYYHNDKHTLHVAAKALEIGKHENCTAGELELLYAAALWHDTGYINTYAGHEAESCVLAQQYLPGYGFSSGDINKVCAMIMATRIPQSPQSKLEEIIADADLEYLGTEDAGPKADLFFKELQHLNPTITKTEWDKRQITFLQQHKYFTRYCRENKEPVKLKYLAGLVKNS